ncbi:hypothetical protein EPI10_020576 [Gossypium australe]|uniref:Uncharacterized protein n=1 Tax=Gossypium australe TaxID=47621 RepID=A0A5B6WG17_9ROSI|nr:hypothetical protein EPI10_020576 [Gossypium australe]
MSIVDYEREYSRLSKYAKELIPTEEENYKRYLRGMWHLLERAKMVEQSLGLCTKVEPHRATEVKNHENLGNQLQDRACQLKCETVNLQYQ